MMSNSRALRNNSEPLEGCLCSGAVSLCAKPYTRIFLNSEDRVDEELVCLVCLCWRVGLISGCGSGVVGRVQCPSLGRSGVCLFSVGDRKYTGILHNTPENPKI